MIIDSPIISGSYSASGSLNQFGNVVISGSLTVTGSIIGNITGSADSASFAANANSASYALTSSFSLNVPVTASYANNANSASFATTASNALTASYLSGYVSPFPFTGSAIISGSLEVTGSANIPNITGSLLGTASFANTATSSSYALTASFSLNVPVTSSYANNANSASYALSASFATTASYLSGYVSPFPFTGSAIISGSLTVTGSVAVSNLSGSGVRYLVTDESGSITAQSASAALKSTQAFTSTAGQTTFAVTNGYSTGYVDVFINGSKLATAEFTDTSGTNIVLATGSFINDTVEVVKYTPAAGVTNNVLRQLTTFTASAAQTVFSASYTPGLLDIFYNGSRLSPADFTANNGTFFTLATGSAANDILDVLVYSYQVGAFSGIGGVGTADQIAFFGTTNSITGSPNFTISGSTMLITGSLTISGSSTFTNIGPAVFSGSLTSTAGFTGSFSGTATSASYASNADLLDGLDSTVFTLTSSFAAFTASQNILNGIYATTGSNTFTGIQTVNSNLVVTGSITAQTLVVQTITSSVDFVTGSTRFGSLSSNTHIITGSMFVTGAFYVTTGSVGIGTTSPSKLLHLYNTAATDVMLVESTQVFSTLAFKSSTNSSTVTIGIDGAGNAAFENKLTTGAMAFVTSGSERMRITSAGNVGIGVTPSAWGNASYNIKALQIGSNGALYNLDVTTSSTRLYLSNNVFIDSAVSERYIATGPATSFFQQAGEFYFKQAVSGTAGAAISFTNALTISTTGVATFYGDTSLQGNNYINSAKMIQWEGGSYWSFRTISSAATFQLYQGSTGATPISVTTNGQINFKHSTTNLDVVTLENGSASPYGMNITYTAASPNNGSNNYLYFADSTTLRFAARSNGGLSNYSGNNVNLASDRRLKKDISPLSTEWDKLKQIEVVNFKYKDSTDETALYGAIAQQVQEVYPNLVIVTREATETEPEYYGLREQPFQWLTTKVLQEAMAKIEEQQALITALQEKLERNNIN